MCFVLLLLSSSLFVWDILQWLSRLAVSGHRAKPHPAFPPFPGFLSRSPPLFSRLLSPSAILVAIHPSPHRLFPCVLPTCRIPPDFVHPESRIALFIFIEVL